ncbi:hypothetical protein RSAG8_02272, partial [Rhizoctonia solani AG-8 WAC10335]
MRLITGSNDHTLRTWAARDPFGYESLLTGRKPLFDSSLCFSSGVGTIFASNDRTLRLWDFLYVTLLPMLRLDTPPTTGLQILPLNTFIHSGLYDHIIRTWDTHARARVKSPQDHSDNRAISRDNSNNSDSFECAIQIWDIDSGMRMASPFEVGTGSIKDCQ